MNAKKGFTLVEIMIVVAIIAILAAIAIPNFIGYRKAAQCNSCFATVKQIKNAAEAWSVQHPNNNSGCTVADLWKSDGTGFLKMTAKPVCPKDNSSEYTLTYTAATASYEVTCPNHQKNDAGGWEEKASK